MKLNTIKKDDWEVVESLALKYVNETIHGESEFSEKIRFRIIEELHALIDKYGEHPVLLSTLADYCEELNEKRRLLKISIKKFEQTGDVANLLLSYQSFVDACLETIQKKSRVSTAFFKLTEVAIDRLSNLVKSSGEEFDLEQLMEVKKSFMNVSRRAGYRS